ncbi:MAG: bifunctional folylpolyglutamate synthase/dihydrofolate synthase [Clostridia bacterium]|nr:bifunctional folylpolyglutamate synthase/dihydrofolate synthase [Clostridia bacterium]
MGITYKEALDYIHAVGFFGSKPGLERIRELCRLLGDPQKGLDFIHVAGTNGKGSVCSMLSEILTSAGLKTGLYTSPFVSFFEERIRVCGKPIPKRRLAGIIEKVKTCADRMADRPTEFEIITAAAFVYYREEKCDAVVLETGLGGRLDATNIIEKPLAAVITGISLDHKAVLGDTEEKIAAEKGGIIKPDIPLVLARCGEAAKSAILGIAESKNAPVTEVDYGKLTGKAFSLDGCRFDMPPYGEVRLSLAGVYQADNAAVAITAAEVLKSRGLPIKNKDIIAGVKKAKWDARFEVISKSPLTVYDGAHNAEGAAALAENIRVLLGSRVILLAGVMADKDYSLIAETLSPLTEHVFTVTPETLRALPCGKFARVFASLGVDATPCDSIEKGVCQAVAAAKETGLPLVLSGTLYMYRQAKDAALEYLKK